MSEAVTYHLLALLIGVIAGLRTMAAPAAVSWAASFGWLDVSGTWLAFLANPWVRWILTALALVELVVDQLPSTPSRTVPPQFAARIVAGGLAGAAVGAGGAVVLSGLLAGVVGAVGGTVGGRACRGWLANAFGGDHPAAFLEDAVALGGALLILMAAR
jgi:uncharacterized membrane protein